MFQGYGTMQRGGGTRRNTPFLPQRIWTPWRNAFLTGFAVAILMILAVAITFGVLESRDDKRYQRLRRDITQLRTPVGFLARKSGTQSIPVGVLTTVTGWIIAGPAPGYDASNGAMNLATGVYTTPFDGKYQVSASICWSAGALNTRRMIFLTNGSTATTPLTSLLALADVCTTMSETLDLETAMTVEVQVTRTTAGAELVNAFSTFSIERIADL